MDQTPQGLWCSEAVWDGDWRKEALPGPHDPQDAVFWKCHSKGRSEGGLGRKARGDAVSYRDGKVLPGLRGE